MVSLLYVKETMMMGGPKSGGSNTESRLLPGRSCSRTYQGTCVVPGTCEALGILKIVSKDLSQQIKYILMLSAFCKLPAQDMNMQTLIALTLMIEKDHQEDGQLLAALQHRIKM